MEWETYRELIASAEVCGLTFFCALRTEETRSLDAEYGVYSVNPWDED